mgnify:CR=1 FL=1
MRADFKVVLDACVLANYGVANLLLLLAERPRLYLPIWSEQILEETRRTQVSKLGWPDELVDSFHLELRSAFPEALVEGFEHIIGHCGTHQNDAHVLACAIHSKAELILTFNLRHFPAAALETWKISVKHPQDYLLTLFQLEPLQVMQHLGAIAEKRKCSLEDHLIDLGKFLPAFSARLLEELDS